jgi:hypothetical protein
LQDLPADVKSFSKQVNEGLEKIKDPELQNLVRNGKQPVSKNGSTLMDLAAENPERLESEFQTWKKNGSKGTFEEWLAKQAPEFVHKTTSYPAGLVEEGLDTAGARRSYDASIIEDPSREVAIWKDPATGEHVCVQGEAGFVETSWMTSAENQRNGQMPRWKLEIHHHPGRGVFSDHLPSANDFQSIMHWQTLEGVPQRTRSVLTYIDAESKLRFQTEFGFEPGARRPYWTRYRTSDGTWKIATFEKPPFAEGAVEYDAFVHSFKGDPNAPVPGGNVYPVAETGVTTGAEGSVTGVPNAPSTTPTKPDIPLRPPADRHKLTKVDQRTVAKDLNTVIESGIDVAGDVADINAGKAIRSGNTYTINGRTYGFHDDILYPISGSGFHQLDRGAFKALGVYNKFGNTSKAIEILDNMKIGEAQRQAALDAWKAGQGGQP